MSSIETASPGADALTEERQYWLDKLAGGPRPAGPRPDHARPGHRCARSATVEIEIAGEAFEKLNKLTGGDAFLEYAALAAALTACLYRHTQISPIVIGCPAMRMEDEPADPRNAVAVINDANGQMTFRQLLLAMRQTLLDAHARQRYPFAQLLQDLKVPEAASRGPLFDVSLAHTALHHGLP